MKYQGKFESNVARKLYTTNSAYSTNKTTQRQKIINMRRKLLKATVKKVLMAIGLLLAYASMFGMFLGMLLLAVKPSIGTYLLCGFSAGYAFLVLNCRAFEYIGDRMGSKW